MYVYIQSVICCKIENVYYCIRHIFRESNCAFSMISGLPRHFRECIKFAIAGELTELLLFIFIETVALMLSPGSEVSSFSRNPDKCHRIATLRLRDQTLHAKIKTHADDLMAYTVFNYLLSSWPMM